ncbi:MAG: FAD synthetase family protein [Alistipes sp.]
MRVFYGLDHLPSFRWAVATVGSYDGIHCGHRYLLQRVMAEATRLGGESIVFTFDPHPRITLGKDQGLRLLTSLDEKIYLLDKMGIDNLVVIPFDRAFSCTSSFDFLRLLVEKAHVQTLIVGYDHRFGRNKEGGCETLEQARTLFHLHIVEINEQEVEREHVSSTVARKLIEKGDMAHAAKILGHPYLIIGQVDSNGTVTLTEPLKLLPQSGAYAVSANGCAAQLIVDGRSLRLIATSVSAGEINLTF